MAEALNDDPASQPFPQPPPGHRDWYAFEAIRAIPRLLLMVDHNPYSRTYGCFDRSFWHYRTVDFPCGMSQEFVLPLALAHSMDLPHNPYHGIERMRQLALAGVDYAIASSHPNGTCDDYFPYERAMGALVFSLYAMTEACLVLGDRNERRLKFFARRGDWLLKHNETGQLANHQAFAALAMQNVHLITGESRYRDGARKFRDLTLSWRHEEGWFQEYEGADPGYHSCLISFLAKYWQKSGDDTVIEPLKKAVEFAAWFMHPDGSYAGEYGSRNTYHFYPHGFEVMAPMSETAGRIADSFLHRAMPGRTRYYNDDDRMAAHYIYDWMQAWRDHAPRRTGPIDLPPATEARWFDDARMLVVRTPRYHFVGNASKGGTFKMIGSSGPIAGDTGIIGKLTDGTVVVTHIVDREESTSAPGEDGRSVRVAGWFQQRKIELPTPWKMIVFRLLLLTVGRFHANLVRSLLQKKLIVGKRRLRIRFKREIQCREDGVAVIDEIEAPDGHRFERLSAGSDATSIYVANSNTHQFSRLLPWTDLDGHIATLNAEGRVRIERFIRADA